MLSLNCRKQAIALIDTLTLGIGRPIACLAVPKKGETNEGVALLPLLPSTPTLRV
jgi:hypothetical protein